MDYNMILYFTLIILFFIIIIFFLLQHMDRELDIQQFHYEKLIEEIKNNKGEIK